MARMKKFVAWLLCVLMLLQALPMSALAEGIALKVAKSNVLRGSAYHNVYFYVNAEDTTTPIASQLVESGTNLPAVPEAPDKEGYTFTG